MVAKIKLTGDWILSEASVTAIRRDGVPLTRDRLTLRVCEGRNEHISQLDRPDKHLSALVYEMSIIEVSSQDPDEITLHPAQIVVVGTMADGNPCKIFGHGFVGQDNLGQFEASFQTPPVVELISVEEPISQAKTMAPLSDLSA
jgi:hypothetical protein